MPGCCVIGPADADSKFRILFLALCVLGIVLCQTRERVREIVLPCEANGRYEVGKEPVAIGSAGVANCREK